MRARVAAATFVLAAIAGCSGILGIEDLVSDERDSGLPPRDAADEVAIDAGADSTPEVDAATDAEFDGDRGYRYVFVTRGAFDGNLQGVAGATKKCNDAAEDAGLPRTYVPWISGDSVHAIDRIKFDGPHKRLDEEQVFINKAQILSGNLSVPIDRDERKQQVGGNDDQRRVWTGTFANGKQGEVCANWTNNVSTVGTMGWLHVALGGKWTDNGGVAFGTTSCSAAGHLYCFEQ